MPNIAMKHAPKMEMSQITDLIFLGTSMCCDKHKEYHAEILKENNIFADIDMRAEQHDEDAGVSVQLRLPVLDTYPPTPEQVKVGTDLIDNIVRMGKKVYVHCQVGHGRSPTLVIAYFILKRGMSFDEAYALVKSKRDEVHPTDRQIEFLKVLEKSL